MIDDMVLLIEALERQKARIAMEATRLDMLDCDAVIERLRTSVNAAGGQRAWAAKHGISDAYVNDVLHGRRLPGDKITKALGLEKALLWRTPTSALSHADSHGIEKTKGGA